jgi:hypothetical protein
MTAHKRIEVTIQTDQVVMIWRRACARRWCPECGRDVDVVDPVQAEILAGITSRLQAGTEVRKRHLLEGPEGTIVVCLESVLKRT